MDTTQPTSPIPINEAEAIFEPFWDASITHLSDWRLDSAPGSGAATGQQWAWANLTWEHAPVGEPVMAISRRMDVDLEGFDLLIMRLAMPRYVRVTVTARVDGQPRTIIDREPGRANPHEYEGPIAGRRLEELTLRFISERDLPQALWIFWIGLAHAGRRAHMLGVRSPFNARWDGFLLPEATTPTFAPRFGFLFGAEDLPAIRRRARSAAYRPLVEHLRGIVHDAMTFHKTPEEQVGPWLGCGNVRPFEARERDWDTRPFYNDAVLCALFGLIDEDPALLRFAARVVISTCHVEHWRPQFTQGFPGSTWDNRAGPEAQLLSPLVLAADWAGSWLTPKGEHLLRYSLTHKGMGRIRGTFLQYDYMWECNQHFFLIVGRLFGLLYQQRAWPRTEPDIDQCEKDLYEIIDRYFQADGSTHEGMGYWDTTARAAALMLLALARYRGKPVGSMIPEKLHRTWDYAAPLFSTAGDPASYLTFADVTQANLFWDTLSLLYASGVRGGWGELVSARLRSGKPCTFARGDMMFDGALTLIYGPDEPLAMPVRLPAFARLDMVGTVTSTRTWQGEPLSLILLGNKAHADHAHADKGSFILEVAGETFAGDRGITPYEDSEGWFALKSEYTHNIAHPEGVRQLNPAPAFALWQAQGDEVSLSGEIDVTAVWQAPVRLAKRYIRSPQPQLIEVVDEFELDEPRRIFWYLNTPLPIVVRGKQATVQGERSRLTVSAEWAESVEAGPYFFDWGYRPYNRLVATSPKALRHVLKTVLTVEKRST